MKRNFNVIQIKGFMGIIYLAFIGVCLAAGFGWFPGWVCMKLWNFGTLYVSQIPAIGIFQGILLWGIIAASYYTFRKDKLVVFMNASEGLSEEELKAIFADMKKQAREDTFIKNMLKSRSAELRIRNLSESNIPSVDIREIKNTSSVKPLNGQEEKLQHK